MDTKIFKGEKFKTKDLLGDIFTAAVLTDGASLDVFLSRLYQFSKLCLVVSMVLWNKNVPKFNFVFYG
jgi:hypothetical protein